MTIRTGDRQLIKELNIALVIHQIRQQQPIPRVEIAERTGLGRSTVTGIINTLIREGLVSEVGSAESPAGRKPVLLSFNARALFAVGIKLGPTSARVAMVDSDAVVVDAEEVSLSAGPSAEAVIGPITRALAATIDRTGVARAQILGVGVAMPGVVDPATGTAVSSYFLGWDHLPIRDILEQGLGLPVFVDNDANAMALAEALYGAGRGATDLLGVTVGVGIGSGVIVGGRIHRGARFSAGELGHVCVAPGGPQCVCGRQGCLEAVASDAAIVRRARAAVAAGSAEWLRRMVHGHADLVTRELVVAAAKHGDAGALAAVAEAGQWLGLAVGNAVNLLSPALVVVGGEAALDAGDLLLAPMRIAMAQVLFPAMPDEPLLVPGSLGRDAWVQGAAGLVLADAFRVPLAGNDTGTMVRRVGMSEPFPYP